jgi:hypothetical protein
MYAMHYSRMVIILLFSLVILICAMKSSAHDVQKQQSEDIAIHDENDFWQPPLEPGKQDQVIAEHIECIRQTSRSTGSGYPKCYYRQMDITRIIPPCLEW